MFGFYQPAHATILPVADGGTGNDSLTQDYFLLGNGTDPAIAGTDNAGRVTVGSSANGGKCTVTFAQEWTNPPVCIVQNESTSTPVRPINVSTTSFEITGTISSGDSLVYQCQGYY